MAAVLARPPAITSRSSTPPPHHISLNTSTRGTPAAIPNKHIPVCPPGPIPARGLQTPPSSPPTKNNIIETTAVTYPPNLHCTQYSHDPPLWTIDAQKMAEAIEHTATQPLPNPEQVFPWLHGLHADNQIQLAFFTSRRKSVRKVPLCIRSVTLVKTGGDLTSSKLKGAISPEELLCPTKDSNTFIECDPKDGFSVRNFHIQACKLAMVSDIIVYGDDKTPLPDTVALAKRISKAQRQYEARNGLPRGLFNTFMLSDTFAHVQEAHPELVAVDAAGGMTGHVADFFYWERYEMSSMSKAAEISNNVYLGPTPDPTLDPNTTESDFDILIEASDLAHIPDSRCLTEWRNSIQSVQDGPMHIEFPSSGSIMPPTWSHSEVDGLLAMCKWIYDLANPHASDILKRRDSKEDEAIALDDIVRSRKFLIHCTDGYTETTMLALAYFMYAEGLSADQAWVQMHRDKGRNFFAYPSDVALLTQIQPRILQASPKFQGNIITMQAPKWMSRIDGSLPSRILPYMYLGNLGHANNPELLRELGITRILSVGESLSWTDEMKRDLDWPDENLMLIDRVQDNGVDPLWDDFGRCLKFIEDGKLEGGATLVHCRVGVSRSATICIAEVMNELGLSFPRAYCFVRARRLNVIIQPHLRFTYELLKWEEYQRLRRNEPLRRELEWATVSREIALMNKPYSR
ncbi:dual specificity protein phosphatase-like protein PPS1 [Aaosphaeria arxii CBS 175.79]|uniref:Dual specificity protein phosphatase-like protein PPS1 n=1 Tax=Aaosphaeria arxii CBS 175.79 TaxID=1450172 RepID=A0A6A5XAS8_9PLEO|nr:dual specificity protein phosphatase-like protein PPS1 [Aaosphaeria arxii CBS 175.79]KAF2010078.1 dual specificity protein phosphatase-like protein PPS1 [Aaosphaeria arxii CBS 175.79]